MPIDNKQLADLRQNYSLKSLDVKDVSKNPIVQFSQWFEEAIEAQLLEPNAMVLTTVKNNKPSSRIVLLKGIKKKSISFFYQLRK
jgi:pyridoxamine 5'-phosphate oxidase